LVVIFSEVSAVYKSMTLKRRQQISNDAPKLIRQILSDVSGDKISILLKGFELMELIIDDHYDALHFELKLVLNRIMVYIINCLN
jgi:hypothetical protein